MHIRIVAPDRLHSLMGFGSACSCTLTKVDLILCGEGVNRRGGARPDAHGYDHLSTLKRGSSPSFFGLGFL